MNEQNNSVVITGASRGIGRQIALAFSRQTNHPLVLIARTEKDLIDTKQQCREEGDHAIAVIACDLTDPKAVQGIALPEGFPEPGIIINNAGSYLLKPLSDTTTEEFHKQVEVNLYSAVYVTNRFLSALYDKPYALVVNICSEGALKGLDDSGAYSASKHGLLGYTRSLRQELLDTGIGVTAINLGQTQSTSWKDSSISGDRLIDPGDVAEVIITLSRLSPRTVVEEILVKPQHGRVPPM